MKARPSSYRAACVPPGIVIAEMHDGLHERTIQSAFLKFRRAPFRSFVLRLPSFADAGPSTGYKCGYADCRACSGRNNEPQ